MINFRYHLVSLVAVFLALAMGVIMGTAVIDNAVVDRLEAQQDTLDGQVAQVREENATLERTVADLDVVAERLLVEGIGRLRDVPVLVVGVRGGDVEGLDELRASIGTVGARLAGTIWLTDRWELEDAEATEALREATGATATSGSQVRAEAVQRLAVSLRQPVGDPGIDTRAFLRVLQEEGFVQFEAPEGQTDVLPLLDPGIRILLVSPGPGAVVVPDRHLAQPLARALVADLPQMPDRPAVPTVVAVPGLPEKTASDQLVLVLRRDDSVNRRLSTVDDLAEETGRVAAILALADAGRGVHGHFGRGPEASDRLPPAPPTQSP